MLIQIKNYFIAFASGILLTFMIQTNSLLAKGTNPIFASWVAHGVGSIFAFLLVLIATLFSLKHSSKNKKINPQKIPLWYFLGGIPGAFTVVLAAYAVNGNLSLSGTISLMLVGQVLFGMALDHFGLMGLSVRKMTIKDLSAIALVLLGSGFILLGGVQV
jgi:transporter family-2 protein